MNVERAILPGIIVGSLIVVIIATFAAHPTLVLASTPPASSISSSPEITQGNTLTADASGFVPVVQSNQEQAGIIAECTLSGNFASSILQWCGLIEKYAQQNGLEPALIAALITQESAGDPQAYSHSGAVGLMQVMPRDGLASSFMCPAGPCFADRPSTQELYDPEFNVSYGTNMLAGLLNRHGNMRDALKSYGPRDVGYYYADIVLGIYNSSR